MAIDPTIVLGLKPPPVLDIQGALTKAAQYRNLISESQYRDQERQTNIEKQKREQQQNAESDRKLAGDQLEGQLIAANTTTGQDGTAQTNHDAVRQGLAAQGQGDRAATYLTRVQIPAETEQIKIRKDKLDTAEKSLSLIGQGLGALQKVPDENLPQAHDEEVAKLVQAGAVKPGEIPSAAQIMGPTGDINLLKQAHQTAQLQTLKGSEQVTASKNDADFAQKLVEFKQKTSTEAPKVAKDWTDTLSQVFGAATTPEQWQGAQKTAIQSGAPLSIVSQFGDFGPDAVARANDLGKTSEQRQTAQAAADTLAQTKLRDQNTAKYQAGELANKQAENTLQAKKFAAEFGGDAVKGWAATIKDNPDAASSIPANLRNAVQQQFSKDTGLPFPKPLSGPTKTQETAARNGLAALQQVSEDIKDPEVQSRLGPIMGRLGEAEQDVGATAGLSPEAAAKAQRLRTNMRMMALQEGKAVFGGRVPQKMMEHFQSASPNDKMEPGTLQGALEGMQDAGMRALDSADQERFGGKMRTREDRGVKAVEFGGGAPSLPVKLSASDVGKTYVNKAGKSIKITAVNPQDSTQFKFEETK